MGVPGVILRRGPASGREEGRAQIRAAVAEMTGRSVDPVEIGAVCADCGGDHGRPLVVSPSGVWVSLSRPSARDLTIVAVSLDGPIGVDVERWDLDPVRLTGAAAQLGMPDELPSADPRAVIRAWTTAEAVLKADGRGVRIGPSMVQESGTPDARHAWIGSDAETWSIVEMHDPVIDAADELCITVAHGPTVSTWSAGRPTRGAQH